LSVILSASAQGCAGFPVKIRVEKIAKSIQLFLSLLKKYNVRGVKDNEVVEYLKFGA